MKSYRNFSGSLYFKINMLCARPLYSPVIMKMISDFTLFFIFPYSFLHFHMISAAPLLIISFFFLSKLIMSTTCSLKDSQNFFMQYLLLYIPCLFSMVLNDDIVDTEKTDGICSLIFVVNEFSGFFNICQSFLLNIQDLHK